MEKQKPEKSVPTMPSVFFTDGMHLLRCTQEAKTPEARRICEDADNYQIKNAPGKAQITMAAFASVLLFKLGTYRSQKEMAKAFSVSEVKLRERLREIRRR